MTTLALIAGAAFLVYILINEGNEQEAIKDYKHCYAESKIASGDCNKERQKLENEIWKDLSDEKKKTKDCGTKL